jgi:hypothetical protein
MVSADALLGGWDLVEWTVSVDGVVTAWPMGRDATGLLAYCADGSMSAVLMRRDRARFGTSQFPDGTDELRLAAADGYLSYGGWFDVDRDHVVHHVEVSLFPDFIGTELVRTVRSEGAELILTSEPHVDARGREIVNDLRWRRRHDHR